MQSQQGLLTELIGSVEQSFGLETLHLHLVRRKEGGREGGREGERERGREGERREGERETKSKTRRKRKCKRKVRRKRPVNHFISSQSISCGSLPNLQSETLTSLLGSLCKIQRLCLVALTAMSQEHRSIIYVGCCEIVGEQMR